MMKKMCAVLILAGLAGLGLPSSGQQLREERTVVNVGVPVRVFLGERFVPDLTLNDFEVYEDGVLQKLEAVYLVRGTAVERREELTRFAPKTNRHFYLFFEITEYTAKIGEALDYFIGNVLLPGDTLSVITPLKTYRMHLEALEVQPKARIADQLKGLLRQDSVLGNSEYRHVVSELENIARALTRAILDSENGASATGPIEPITNSLLATDFSPEQLLMEYAATLANFESFRKLDLDRMVSFASLLKEEEGQKYVFVFYQREFLPEVEPRILEPFLTLNQDRPDVQYAVASVFDFYKRYNTFDLDKIKQVYAHASIAIHFLFIAEPRKQAPGLIFRERSEDIYSAFKEMAVATGGFVESSANPEMLLKHAVDSAENYYLLYYTPLNAQRDGRFRRISIKVKSGGYRVTNRQGYIAD